MSRHFQCRTVKLGLLIVLSLIQGFWTDCRFDAKLSLYLDNEGFHRNLAYIAEINDKRMDLDGCALGLDHMLPSGVYASEGDLVEYPSRRKVNTPPEHHINTELPTEQAAPTNVVVVGNIKKGRVHVELPVHARYHLARNGGGMVRSYIGPPKLFLYCPDQRLNPCRLTIDPGTTTLCDLSNSKHACDWRELPFTPVPPILFWDTPVGNLHHYVIVGLGTALVVLLGSLYLIKVLHTSTVYKFKRKKV